MIRSSCNTASTQKLVDNHPNRKKGKKQLNVGIMLYGLVLHFQLKILRFGLDFCWGFFLFVCLFFSFEEHVVSNVCISFIHAVISAHPEYQYKELPCNMSSDFRLTLREDHEKTEFHL